jgi:hypothetical protein
MTLTRAATPAGASIPRIRNYPCRKSTDHRKDTFDGKGRAVVAQPCGTELQNRRRGIRPQSGRAACCGRYFRDQLQRLHADTADCHVNQAWICWLHPLIRRLWTHLPIPRATTVRCCRRKSEGFTVLRLNMAAAGWSHPRAEAVYRSFHVGTGKPGWSHARFRSAPSCTRSGGNLLE